jgi:hypothetical protein
MKLFGVHEKIKLALKEEHINYKACHLENIFEAKT